MDSAAPDSLMQFTSQGNILGFRVGRFYVSNGTYALHVDFLDANPIAPASDTPSASNGQGAPPLSRVEYTNLWEGITLVYDAARGGVVSSSYRLEAQADPRAIHLRYNAPVTLNSDGTLTIAYATGQMVESAPLAWQEVAEERVPVHVTFELRGEREVGFAVAEYDATQALFIDPTLTWNTFLGGGADDIGYAIAVDASGNVYIAGYSTATWGSPVRAFSIGDVNAFAAKLDSSGSLTWNTFLGGGSGDIGRAIAVDGSGNIYVTGYSYGSWGSPVRAFSGGVDAFAAKLISTTGALTWNTFLGGSGNDDEGWGIAVDGSGNVYVGGFSNAVWGSPVMTYTLGNDAFAAKLNATTGALTWNTFLGGSGDDSGTAIAVDGNGNVYVAGESTATWGLPVRPYTSGGFLGKDAFAAKLNSSGTLTWNTFLGGSEDDSGNAIAVDGNGNVYVAGWSLATWGAPVRAFSGFFDAFAAKLDSSGNLTWTTFLGGSGADLGYGIAVDASGNAYVAGNSNVTWQGSNPPVRAFGGNADAFAAKLNATTGALTWNTFLGGSGYDFGYAIAVDGSSNVYVAGYGLATWGSPVRAFSGGEDAFAAKVNSSGMLTWNTFLGGGGNDFGNAIAVDGIGNVYVAGTSNVTWGSPVMSYTLGNDAFAAKLNSSGSLLWNTFLGGSGDDYGYGIAVDVTGTVYVAGYSNATWGSSPVMTYTGGLDAFAAKLDSNGNLTWNAFLGGSGGDSGYAIAVDGSGNVYVAGYSTATWGSSPVLTYTSGLDAFAAKLDSNGNLAWNTFLGGNGDDSGRAIAVGGSSNVYVAGYSTATWGSPVGGYTLGYDAFAAKLNATTGGLIWNSFLGGSGSDFGNAIAVDGSGNVYVAGNSNAAWGSPVRAYSLGNDAFAAKLNSSGALTWNSFLGGSAGDFGNAIAVDGSGSVYVAGYSTATWGFPISAFSGNSDAFAAKLNSSGVLNWNTFLGGSGSDVGNAIAVDGSSNVYVAGSSTDTWGSPVRIYRSASDAFVAKFHISSLYLPLILK